MHRTLLLIILTTFGCSQTSAPTAAPAKTSTQSAEQSSLPSESERVIATPPTTAIDTEPRSESELITAMDYAFDVPRFQFDVQREVLGVYQPKTCELMLLPKQAWQTGNMRLGRTLVLNNHHKNSDQLNSHFLLKTFGNQHYLITLESGNVWLRDAETMFPLPSTADRPNPIDHATDLGNLFSSDSAASPWIVAEGCRGSKTGIAIDLSSNGEHFVRPSSRFHGSLGSWRLSPDGKLLINFTGSYANHFETERFFNKLKVDEDIPSFSAPTKRRHICYDPLGKLFICADGVSRLDTTSELQPLNAPPILATRDGRWIVARDGKQLHWYDRASLAHRHAIDLPKSQAYDVDQPTFARDTVVKTGILEHHINGFETADGNYLLTSPLGLMVVHVDRIELPTVKPLHVEFALPKTCSPGEALSLEVSTQADTLRLLRGPEGAALTVDPDKPNRDQLVWTPTTDHVGTHDFEFETRTNIDVFTDKRRTRVSFPQLPLSFRVAGLSMSADGERAVAWSEGTQHETTERITGMQLAIVDIPSMQLIAQRTLEQSVLTADLDNASVYVLYRDTPGSKDSPAAGSMLERFSVTELLPLSQMKLPQASTDLVVYGGSLVILSDAENVVAALDARTGNESWLTPWLKGINLKRQPAVCDLGEHWAVGSLCVDRIMQNALFSFATSEQSSLLSLTARATSDHRPAIQQYGTHVIPQSRHLSPMVEPGPPVVLPDRSYSVTTTSDATLKGPLKLRLHDPLVRFKKFQDLPTLHKVPIIVPNGNTPSSTPLWAAGEYLLTAANQTAYRIPLSAVPSAVQKTRTPSDYPEIAPLRIRPAQSASFGPIVIDGEEPTSIPFAISGGVQPYKVVLELNILGITEEGKLLLEKRVDNDTLFVNGAALTQTFGRNAPSSACINFFKARLRDQPESEPAVFVRKYLDDFEHSYGAAFGKLWFDSISGFPIGLGVKATVTDANGSSSELTLETILLIPIEVAQQAIDQVMGMKTLRK